MTSLPDPNLSERLEKLQDKIDDIKQEALPEERDEQRFIDSGALDDENVDDTIAPPG